MHENISIDLKTFKIAVDNAYDHVVITDLDGTVVYANNAVERVTGYKKEDVIGQKAGKLWGGQMDAEFYSEFWDIIKNRKKTFVGEIINKRKNGETYTAEVRVTPISVNGELKFFLGIERDISAEEQHKKLLEFASSREGKILELKREIEMLEKQIKGGASNE